MTAHLSTTVLDSPEPRRLAAFYAALLGWEATDDDEDWVVLRPGPGLTGLAFQREPLHEPPTWPSARGVPQMQLHLDVQVADMAGAAARAVELGARLAEWQPQQDCRVLLDPDGHVFCLFEH